MAFSSHHVAGNNGAMGLPRQTSDACACALLRAAAGCVSCCAWPRGSAQGPLCCAQCRALITGLGEPPVVPTFLFNAQEVLTCSSTASTLWQTMHCKCLRMPGAGLGTCALGMGGVEPLYSMVRGCRVPAATQGSYTAADATIEADTSQLPNKPQVVLGITGSMPGSNRLRKHSVCRCLCCYLGI